MIAIRSSADLARALDGPLAPPLRRLLAMRRDQLLGEGTDLAEIAHIIVVQPNDTVAELEEAAGVPIATNLVDGKRLGQRGFTHSFEFIQHHPGGWIEAVMVLTDDGFSVALFLPDRIDLDPRLLRLLAA